MSQLSRLQLCDKSKLYFELGIIVPRRESKMNKSTDMEPKSLVGGGDREDISPYPPGFATEYSSSQNKLVNRKSSDNIYYK